MKYANCNEKLTAYKIDFTKEEVLRETSFVPDNDFTNALPIIAPLAYLQAC
jgi:hypothetical protein